MTALAAWESVLLAIIAALHVAWGCGVVWPGNDEAALEAAVVGSPRGRMPTPTQCFVAGGAILATAAVIAGVAGILWLPLPSWAVQLLGLGAAAVFAGRGIAGYLPAWRAMHPREPFARLDRWAYSPLCLVIALTIAGVLLNQVGHQNPKILVSFRIRSSLGRVLQDQANFGFGTLA
jgi:hypothetical protein